MRHRLRARAWTDDELAVLRQMAGDGRSKLAIAARLGRSISSICRQARLAGLELERRQPRFTLRELDRQMVESSHKMHGFIRLPRNSFGSD
jgi:hypothetical protein